MIAFGIDLAGYTTANTSVAAFEIKGRTAQATLLHSSALSVKHETGDALKEIMAQDVAVLRRCLGVGPVAVDIPIDLQGLPNPASAEYVWQLTLRPIDRAVHAMPAFADRIGAPVARFAAIMREGEFDDCLGRSLFETYPAEIWRRLNIKAKYKGADGKQGCACLCNALCIEPPQTSEHDIDAMICAMTAAAPLQDICDDSEFENVKGAMPRGFRILKIRSFNKISVATANFDEWMDARERSK